MLSTTSQIDLSTSKNKSTKQAGAIIKRNWWLKLTTTSNNPLTQTLFPAKKRNRVDNFDRMIIGCADRVPINWKIGIKKYHPSYNRRKKRKSKRLFKQKTRLCGRVKISKCTGIEVKPKLIPKVQSTIGNMGARAYKFEMGIRHVIGVNHVNQKKLGT